MALIEIHEGCGGIVKLGHERWRCLKCGAAPLSIAAVSIGCMHSECGNQKQAGFCADTSRAMREADETRSYAVGDLIMHTNSHRVGRIESTRPFRDGTVEIQVDVGDLGYIWWNSGRVRRLTAAEAEEYARGH
jgi:hypothetical protein